MNGIIYDARRIRAYEGMMSLGEYAGREEKWLSRLWEDLLGDEGLMKEWMYYLDHHSFLDEEKFSGYGLTDIYVWQMDRYNLIREIGKNPRSCNKESMVLGAFRSMLDMKADPETYIRRLTDRPGMDQL